ncbi:MAG: hypothetical protein MJZ62_06740 [Bacteroidales bacterium]|nr:hypothetical protein [Bacteroidales bacterium]
MIKNDKDYKHVREVASADILFFTATKFEKGKRRGVMTIEDDRMIFREMVNAERKRSKPITRTQHFSVLERPDGTIAGTFRFNPSESKIKGKLSAEFWRALTAAMNLKVIVEDE